MFALYEIYMRDVRGLGDAPMLGGGEMGLGWILWVDMVGMLNLLEWFLSSMTRLC